MAKLYYWVANWNLSRASAATLLGNKVEDMVDCTHSSLPRVRECFGAIKLVGGYITGTPDICWTAHDFASLPHDVVALSIDQSDSDLPLVGNVHKLAKDVEPNAATIERAAQVAAERLRAGDDYTIYTMQSWLGQLEGAVRRQNLPPGEIAAYQWASDSSNPNTLLPGTRHTLRDVNCDLSVLRADYAARLRGVTPPVPKPPVPPKPVGRLPRAVITFDPDDGHWTIGGISAGSE